MIAKLLAWLPKNIASILAIVQVAIKLVKEILTAIVNILFPIIPDGKFEEVVLKIRDIVNKVDGAVNKVKDFLLKVGV